MAQREATREGERLRGRRRADRSVPGPGDVRWRRVAAGLAGGALVGGGLWRGSRSGRAAALAGGLLLAGALGVGRQGGAGRDVPSARGPTERSESPTLRRSITVGRPPEELYEAWRDPDRLSRVVGHVADVAPADGDRLRWQVSGPLGLKTAWETRFVEERPGEYLRWETLGDARVPHEGSVSFRPAPGDRGTEVTLAVDFDPPGGASGRAILDRLDVVTGTLAEVALDRFKSLVETGEAPTLERNPSARGAGDRV